VVLEVEGVTQPGIVDNIGFSLRRGEVLGLSGLMGSGRTELARILFGLEPRARGRIRVKGRELAGPTPGRCIRRGMGFLTEDRQHEGLLAEANVEDNVALVALPAHAGWPFGRVRRQPLRSRVECLVRSLGVQCSSLRNQPVKTLSGGNQQKVVLAKWLASGADVLILDEPTRGVDVGAKVDIYAQINRLVADGAGVLLISSEMEELVGMCDRILVMAQGAIQSVVEREDFDRHGMLRSALGKDRLR